MSAAQPAERLTDERIYLREELENLFIAEDAGDRNDVAVTAATLQQILHIMTLHDQDACARIYLENGRYRRPDRKREGEAQSVASRGAQAVA